MRLGFALWVILLARAIASVSYARAQVHRLKRKSQGEGRRVAVGLQVAACVIGVTAIGLRGSLWPASAALAVMAAWHLLSMHRPPVSAKRVGLLQAAAGLALVLVTAIAVRAF